MGRGPRLRTVSPPDRVPDVLLGLRNSPPSPPRSRRPRPKGRGPLEQPDLFLFGDVAGPGRLFFAVRSYRQVENGAEDEGHVAIAHGERQQQAVSFEDLIIGAAPGTSTIRRPFGPQYLGPLVRGVAPANEGKGLVQKRATQRAAVAGLNFVTRDAKAHERKLALFLRLLRL